MSGQELPSFWSIVAYLFCIILCLSVILYASGCIVRDGVQNVPLSVWLPLIGLVVVVVVACLWIVRRLFPNRFRVGHAGTVLKEVMEIEGRV